MLYSKEGYGSLGVCEGSSPLDNRGWMEGAGLLPAHECLHPHTPEFYKKKVSGLDFPEETCQVYLAPCRFNMVSWFLLKKFQLTPSVVTHTFIPSLGKEISGILRPP